MDKALFFEKDGKNYIKYRDRYANLVRALNSPFILHKHLIF